MDFEKEIRLFHYTVGIRLIEIVKDEKIKLETAFVGLGVNQPCGSLLN